MPRIPDSIIAGLALSALLAAPVQATVVPDPAGDFLSTYTGAPGGDLDVLSAGVTFDGTNFVLTSTQAADVGTTSTGIYVWGVDRGAGTARFGTISGTGTGSYDATRVLFDSVIRIAPNGPTPSLQFTDLATGGAPLVTTLDASNITVSGATLTAIIPASVMISRGFAFGDYGFNLWPRDAAAPAGNGQISDFAPDNGVFAVPVPATLGLLLPGLAMLVGARRKLAAR